MIIVGSFLPSLLVGFSTTNFTRAWEVFENPDQINPLPAVDDLAGSAIDAQVLSLYVWLAASRYDEYRNAACVCLAEGLSEAYVIAPPEFSLFREAQPIPLERFRSTLNEWLS